MLGLPLEGDPTLELRGVASLAEATPETLGFVHDAAHAAGLVSSAALAVVAPPDLDVGTRAALRSLDPRADFSRAAKLLVPAARRVPGVHGSAQVAATATLDARVSVGPLCWVG